MQTADYIELRQSPPPPRARADRLALTATLACALLLLLLRAATTPEAALTLGSHTLFGPPASADGSVGTGPAAADRNFGLPASVVIVAEDTVEHARERLHAALRTNSGPNCRGQFSPHRFAFLFLPGEYALDLEVGFYMQVAGLGRAPEQVTFINQQGRGLHVRNCGPEPPGPPHQGRPGVGGYADVGALDNFWRSAENLRVNGTLLWAASQAAPLRTIEPYL